MTKHIVTKSTLALILIFQAASIGKGFSLPIPPPVPTQPSPDGDDPVGGNPDPTCTGGTCFVAVH